MSDGSWTGHEPDTYRYNSYGMDTNYAGPETYRASPNLSIHTNSMNAYDYTMRPSPHILQQSNTNYTMSWPIFLYSSLLHFLMKPKHSRTFSLKCFLSNQRIKHFACYEIYVGILCFESEVFNFLFSNFSFNRLVLSYLILFSLLPRSGGRMIR